jgi:hypothetical protein
MDARIQTRLLQLEQQKQIADLYQERIAKVITEFEIFLRENKAGINRIFELTKAKSLEISIGFGGTGTICYQPTRGFWLERRIPSRGKRVEQEFGNLLPTLVAVYGDEGRNHPENLIPSFISSLINLQIQL